MLIILVSISTAIMMTLLASEAAIVRRCPHCREDLPRYRKPANLRQMLWGGWTCATCGAEMKWSARGENAR